MRTTLLLVITHPTDINDFEKFHAVCAIHKGKIDFKGREEVRAFLNAVADRRNYSPGPSGTIFSWGHIGPKFDVDDFRDTLLPFFEEILKLELGIKKHERILLFHEEQHSGEAFACELYLESESICVKNHPAPFKWNRDD